ncbi:hypothetical protein Tco_1275807 [Tanacetum coccineum]
MDRVSPRQNAIRVFNQAKRNTQNAEAKRLVTRADCTEPEQFSSEPNNILSHSDYALFIVRWWLHEVLVYLTVYAYMVVSGNSVRDPEDWRLYHDLRGERNLCEELDDEGYHVGPAKGLVGGSVKGSMRGSKEIQWELLWEVLDLVVRRAFHYVEEFGNWYRFGTEGSIEASGSFRTSGSSMDILSIFVRDLLTSDSELEFFMEPRFAIDNLDHEVDVQGCVKVFSHVNLNEYIRVALSEGLLIAGKEDSMYSAIKACPSGVRPKTT